MMMKHKRIAALLLALTAAFCLTGAANAADESPVVWEGTLTEVLEDGFVMQEADGREILFNVDEQTALDGFETLEDLDVGMYVIVESDGRLTKSIPPQAHADRVTCYWLAGQVESVDEEENTFLMQTELGEVIVHQGDLTSQVEGSFQIICANIVADVIIRLSKDAGRYLAKDGIFITSGIIDTREQDVLDALEQNGFQVIERRTSGGWVALACKAKAQ